MSTRNRIFTHLVLAQHAGQFVSIDFVKKDGTPRTLTGRVVEQSSRMKHLEDKFVLLKCTGKEKGGYRQVNADTVKAIRAGGRVYQP